MDNTTNNLMLNAFMEAVNAHIDRRVSIMLDARIEKLLEARLSDTATNAQIMGTLDAQLEDKIKRMIVEEIGNHCQEDNHPDNDAIREVVDDMDLTDNLDDKISEIVDDKLSDLKDLDGFTDAVKSVVQDMSFEISVNRY